MKNFHLFLKPRLKQEIARFAGHCFRANDLLQDKTLKDLKTAETIGGNIIARPLEITILDRNRNVEKILKKQTEKERWSIWSKGKVRYFMDRYNLNIITWQSKD